MNKTIQLPNGRYFFECDHSKKSTTEAITGFTSFDQMKTELPDTHKNAILVIGYLIKEDVALAASAISIKKPMFGVESFSDIFKNINDIKHNDEILKNLSPSKAIEFFFNNADDQLFSFILYSSIMNQL